MLPVYLCEEHHVVQNQCILKTNLFEESTIAFVHLHSKLDCGVYPDLDAKFTLSAVATLLRQSGLTDALVALVLRHLLCLFSVRNTSVHLHYRRIPTFWTYGSVCCVVHALQGLACCARPSCAR